MYDFHSIAGLLQAFGNIFRNHHGAVLAAGTAEGDGQITLALVNVMGQKIDQKIRNALDEFACLREGADVFCDFGIASGEGAEFGNEMGVGQEADIENQVGIVGHSVPEPKTDAGDQNIPAFFFFLEQLVDVRAQFVNVEFRGVNHQIGKSANSTQAAALGSD